MQYYLTMERTLRIGVTFDARNDAEARMKANEIFDNAIENPEKFEGGDVEHDFALTGDDFGDIIPWS